MDAAIDLVLDAYERAQREHPRHDPRHRIEHFGVSRPDQVARAAALGVVPVPQGRFVEEIGDGMVRALGPDRVPWAYRARSLLDAGLTLPGSSDRPVVEGAPLLGMHALVNQQTSSGASFNPAEALSGREALHAFTLGSAHASHAEHERGSLSVGKLADLVVLSDDPTTVDPRKIRDIEVLRTMVGGEFPVDRSERDELRTVTADELDDTRLAKVREIYEAGFPDDLRSSFDSLLDDRALVLVDDGAGAGPLGLAVLRDLGDTGWAFLRYLVVDGSSRGRGLGSRFWELLRAALPDHARLVLDVEDPTEGGIDDDERTIRTRTDRLLRAAGCRPAAGARLRASARRSTRGDAADARRPRPGPPPTPPRCRPPTICARWC